MDESYSYFNQPGLRKRTQPEIDLAKSQASKSILRAQNDQLRELVINDSSDILQGLTEMNNQIQGIQFTDLKQEREKNN